VVATRQVGASLPTGRGRGRPRSVSRHGAILDAAVALLLEQGYDALSMDAVAVRAGAGKGAMYRRWANKAALVAEALAHLTREQLPAPRTGGLRTDLIALLDEAMRAVDRLGLATVRGLLADASRCPELATVLQGQVAQQRRRLAAAAVAAAQQRGEVASGVDVALVTETAFGAIYSSLIVLGEPADPSLPARIVDSVVMPCLRPTST
jgi:AcrR family transcriptional regulator